MLMDRGDGTLLFKSDGDPTPSSPPPAAATALREIAFSGVAGSKDSNDNNEADATRAAEPTTSAFGASMVPSPTRGMPQTSPRKAPVNYEEIPINSMYHRIHTVEAEAQDSRRQEELRAEAERREREVREFKASMLAT